jgi:hypothetical protein
MAVDSKDKGNRTELLVRDTLRKLTGLQWERTPLSGALNAVHGLKADLYIPNEHNLFSVEVKGYKDDHISSKILTDKTPQIEVWWIQAARQATETSKRPLLIFKHDRGKLFCATDILVADDVPRYIYISYLDISVLRLEDFINYCKPEWIK